MILSSCYYVVSSLKRDMTFGITEFCSEYPLFFFPEFLLFFFSMMLWFLNSHLIRWYLWAIFIHACMMPILFYGLAGSRCQGLSGGELRGWKRMTNLQGVLAYIFAVSYSIKTNIYNSAPSCLSQPWCKRPRINMSAWDRSSWQPLTHIVFSSSGWKLKFSIGWCD